MRIPESFYCVRSNDGCRGPRTISYVALTKKAVAAVALGQRGSSLSHRVQLLAIIS